MSDSKTNGNNVAAEQKVQEARRNAENKEVSFDQLDKFVDQKINVANPVNVIDISTKVKDYIDSRIKCFKANAYSEQGLTGKVTIKLNIQFKNVIEAEERIVEENFDIPRRDLTDKSGIIRRIGDFILDIPGGDKTIVEGVALCLMKLVKLFDKNRVMASDRMTAEELYYGIVKKIEVKSTQSSEDYKDTAIDGCNVVCVFGKKNWDNIVKTVSDGDWDNMSFLRTLKNGFRTKEGFSTGSMLLISKHREYSYELSDHRYYYCIRKRIQEKL